ncbi:hypothetical protein [Laspinema olomoucense]|uniref:Uncharacterized protein n=1 Tax=Laspinema olomoucense D3b TaxID=2953688 RepID=A0ABT2N4I2_9CYAN|nr:hypothetical protein [Laspinema sp. D3b]MCT7977568.1 hypothetical protein [Laspinema sp. D3b]
MVENTHKVVFDYAGFSSSITRLTCYSDGCNCSTLVRQPYIGDVMWQTAIEQFKQKHPYSSAISWSEYQDLKN